MSSLVRCLGVTLEIRSVLRFEIAGMKDVNLTAETFLCEQRFPDIRQTGTNDGVMVGPSVGERLGERVGTNDGLIVWFKS